ncbi:MAG: O-antigen ligase family protein [Gemmatimonadota bacterium]|nr:O-antigen ligase family protein [Gemmatimonadota bacterium]
MDEPDAPATAAGESRIATGPLVAAIAVAAVGGALAATTFRSFDLDRFFLPKELALQVGAGVAAVVLASRRGPRRWSVADLLLLAWVAMSVASGIGATSGWHALRALAITGGGAAMFWAGAALRAAGRGRHVAVILAVAATAASASALAQAYGFDWTVFATNRAPGGTLGNRNFVAHVAALAVPLLIWITATAGGATGIVLGAAGLLGNTAVLVLSRTRAAWLALAVWLVVAGAVAWRSRDVTRAAVVPRRGRVVLAALATGIVLALVIPNTLDWRSDSPYLDSVRGVVNYREGSGAGRLRQYTNSIKLTRAHPLLGVGPGNWAAEYPAVASRDDPSLSDATGMASNPWPSSDWVAALSERGIPATLALAALVLVLLMNSWRGWRDSVYSSRDRLAALAGGSIVLVAACEGMFDAVSLLAFPTVLIWASAGALIPAGRPVRTSTASARGRTYIAGAMAVAWLGFAAMTAGKIRAMRLYSTGTLDGVRAAATYDPGSYRIQLRAAELLAGRGLCRLAYHNATQAYALFPHASAPQAILARCAGSTR